MIRSVGRIHTARRLVLGIWRTQLPRGVQNGVGRRHAGTPAPDMTVGDGAPGGARAGASSLERDLKDLERLLKADASNGAGNVGAGARSIKQQLRSALRKLMEAFFNPLNGALDSPRDARFDAGASFHRPTLAPPRARRLPFSALHRRPARSNKRPAPSDAQRTSGRCDRSSACSRWRFRNTQRSSRGAARSAFARSPISSRSSRARA